MSGDTGLVSGGSGYVGGWCTALDCARSLIAIGAV